MNFRLYGWNSSSNFQNNTQLNQPPVFQPTHKNQNRAIKHQKRPKQIEVIKSQKDEKR